MYPVYQGVARQRGHGLRDMLKSAFRKVAPVLKPIVTWGLQAFNDATLTHGKEFLQNVIIDKQNPKEAFLKAGKNVLLQMGKDLLGRRETPMNGPGNGESGIPVSLAPQQGQGRKRRRKHPFRGLHTRKVENLRKEKPSESYTFLIIKNKMMHRESCACSKSELDLFAMPPTMMTMQES